MNLAKTDSRLYEALASLNEIGTTVNQIGQDGTFSLEATLKLIVESAIKVVPGSDTVIYAYDSEQERFINPSRVSAGGVDLSKAGDEPRENGLGNLAIKQRRRVLSYEENGIAIHPVQAKAGAKGLACFPLVVADRPVGALYVYLLEARPFSQLELLMLDKLLPIDK